MTEFEQVLQLLDRHEEVLVLGGLGAVAIVAILLGTVRSILKTAIRERSRRDIAAYVAEGSMTPEQGERLLRAETDEKSCC
ncbi:MAG: hypothetical protein ACF8PN_16015 [Phycisphaerales bacterium]